MHGLLKMGLYELYKVIGYVPKFEQFKDGNANTAFVNHANKTYALNEQNFPFEIEIPKSDQEFDIKSKGFKSFGEQLNHNVSAHPKVDRKKKELITYGYDIFGKDGTNLKYTLFDKDNNKINELGIPLRGPVMIHDIAITETNVVFNDLPMQFKPEQIAIGSPAFEFNKNMTAKYGIMNRRCTDVNEIKWFELPNHFVFHFINAWDSVNERGEDIVTMFGCSLNDISLEHKHKENYDDPSEQEHPFLWEA
jgi:carotenoid cleavage dioxygenase-like enzyme